MSGTTPRPHLRIALLRHTYVQFPVYQEIFFALTEALSVAGAFVREVGAVAEVRPDKDDLLLIVGSPNFADALLAQLQELRVRSQGQVMVFLWHLEHLPDLETPAPVLWAMLAKNWLVTRGGRQASGSRAANFDTIRRGMQQKLFDQLFVFTPRKVRFLQRHRITAEYLHCGHHPIWGTPEAGERDIDVLFLGEVLEDRRGAIVRAVRDELEREDIVFKTMYDFNPIGLWGEERNALLRRTKIYLSIYRFPADFSGLRFSLGMGNGALIVSEPVADPYPFFPGEHFVEASIPQLSGAILKYLRDDAARRVIVQNATALLTTDYTMEATATRIVTRAFEIKDQRITAL